jgi:uncharacterized protein (TIGR03435 family)
MIHVMDDIELLRAYAGRQSEAAFTALVQRHIGLVYSAALRQVGEPQLAEEVTQAVFIVLARKARALRAGTILTGWLFRTTRFVAGDAVKMRRRRQQREQQAAPMETTTADDFNWERMVPLLDEAVAGLGERDRHAVLLRFFENKSLAEVGTALGTNEDAARKRIARALDKMRIFFTRRGPVIPAVVIAGLLSARAVQAVPAGLASTVASTAAVQGAAVSGSTLNLIQGALKLMAWTKAKTAIVVGAGILLAAGTATVTVKAIHDHRKYSWEVQNPDSGTLAQAAPQITIVRAKFLQGAGGWVAQDGKALGIGARVNDMLEFAYTTDARMVFSGELPQERYDFIANLPQGSALALRTELKKQFGLLGRREMIETNILVLTVKYPNTKGLKPSRIGDRSSRNPQFGEYACINQPISGLTYFLELYLGLPVIDRTGLTGGFDMDVKWNEPDRQRRNTDGLKQALLDQLGLELVPAREPIEMLVVEKVN